MDFPSEPKSTVSACLDRKTSPLAAHFESLLILLDSPPPLGYLARKTITFPATKETSRPDAAPAPPQGGIVDLVTPRHPDLGLDKISLGALADQGLLARLTIAPGAPETPPEKQQQQLLAFQDSLDQ